MKNFFTLLALMVCLPSLASAQTSVQAQCFDTLKQNLRETVVLSGQADYLDSISYEQLVTDFSKKYRTMSSLGVGVGIDEPRFATRLYSFGEPTGYTHPINTFFPDSQKSERWTTATKQNIVGEEYVIDPSGTEQFLGCFLISMQAPDLMAVTAESYAGDKSGISLSKVAQDASYKAWYAEAPSFDQSGKPLVTWYKLFVYPESARNPYFNKYDVADAFPANPVSDFSVLGFAAGKLKVEDFDEDTRTVVTKYVDLKSGEELNAPAAILPVVPSGLNAFHPYTTYYQAINAAFPDFGQLLSVAGTLKFATFMELFRNQNLDPELTKFKGALFTAGQVNEYYQTKQNATTSTTVDSPELDRLVLLLQHGDWTVSKLKQGASFDTLTYSQEETTTPEPVAPAPVQSTQIIIYLLATVLSLFAAALLYKKLHKTNEYESK